MKSLYTHFFGSSMDKEQTKTYTDEPVEFEDAISETSFGKFNLFLLVFMLLVSCAFMFNTTSMSYVIPSAECDLNISLMDKGVLIAIVHAGMICSAFFIGCLADTLGRKAILFWALIFDIIFNLTATFSHSFHLTLVCKFFSGIFIAGITTMQLTLAAELHSNKYRSPVTMYIGVTFSVAMLFAPIIAWMILTDPQDIYIGTYEFHSWQMYLGVCCVPSILASFCMYYVPESPKFLASKNKTDEALDILKKIYAINTGKSAESFPVKALKPVGKKYREIENIKAVNGNSPDNATTTQPEDKLPNDGLKETSMNGNRLVNFIRDGTNQLKPLFLPPHFFKLLILFMVHFICILGQNSIRLWLPQIFKTMSEYKDEDGVFCDMISMGNKSVVETPRPLNGVCEPIKVASETYENSMIVAGVQVVLGTVTSLTVNYIGRKRLLVTSILTSGLCTLSLYWSQNQTHVTALASLSVALSSISVNCLKSTNVDLFPTSLRAMALSLTLMMGRIGSIVGSIIFPALLALGCLPPFLTIAITLFGGTLLALLIPFPKK